MSRQYMRAEDRYRVAMGMEPEPSRDERLAGKKHQQYLMRKALIEAAEDRKKRQEKAATVRQAVMDKHPEIKVWYWSEVD